MYGGCMSEEQMVGIARARRLAAGSGRRIREAAGLSVRELASGIGVDASTLWRWETGRSRPRGDAAIRWQRTLQALNDEVERQRQVELWGEE